MATVVTHSAHGLPMLETESILDRATRAMLPPRETWPLLVTVAATWLLMLAVVAWYAASAG